MGKKGFQFQLYLAAGFPNLEFLDLDGNSSRVNDIIIMICFYLLQLPNLHRYIAPTSIPCCN